MAVDEAICLAVAQGQAPPTLRFYGWSPPAVSLGYAQRFDEIDWEACKSRSIDVVRRPTGGRAILHDEELTYSVVVRVEDIPDGSSVISSYRWISQGIIRGLRELGLEVSMGGVLERHLPEGVKTRFHGVACFAKPARCDIVYQGKKLVGSAQARRDGVILQHGSIPIRLNRGIWKLLFGEEEDLNGAVCLCEIAQTQQTTVADVERALRKGFEEAVGSVFVEGQLTDLEHRLSQELLVNKHGCLAWVQRKGAEVVN
jgi:lipoate-protein ligase A